MGFFVHDVIEQAKERAVTLAAMNLSCLICSRTEKLVRDHDHETGLIRGILCDRCNQYLGVTEGGGRARRGYKKWFAEHRDIAQAYLSFANLGVFYIQSDTFYTTVCDLRASGKL